MIPWEEYRYTLYAREFGWTPAQVDELPMSVEPWLLPISAEIDRVLQERQAKAEKDAIEKAKNQRG